MTEYYISSTKFTIQERITKKHGKVYDVVFRIVTLDGIEKQKRLAGYPTKTAAKDGYTDFITEHCTLVKRNPLKKKKQTDKVIIPTVGELMPQYILSLKNQSKDSTIYDRLKLMNKYILPKLGELKITELTKEYLYQWQDNLWNMINPKTKEHYSYAYLSHIRNHFGSFLYWVESRFGYSNHLKEVKKPKRRLPKTQMQIWTKEEFDQFISVVHNPMHHTIFTMMFYTGRRRGEILALKPEDVKENSIIFSKTYTRKTVDGSPYKITSSKNEKIGETPICKALKDELQDYEKQSPFLFGGEAPIHENTIAHAFHTYIKRSGVKKIRMHDLRHSFVSMLIHLGANFTVVADLIGDTVEQVTKTYAHMYESDKIDIMSKIY